MPKDENGMLGRECLKCERYFKLKPGTGLPTDNCHCPYCEYVGPSNTFWTQEQIEYAKSIAMQQAFDQVIKPSLDRLTDYLKSLENSTRNSLIKIKVEITGTEMEFPVEYYSEKELETKVVCNECGLNFSIYGVFSNCPDCNRTNGFLIYDSSLEVIQRKLTIFSQPELPEDIRESALNTILTSAISAFDGLGKELKKRQPEIYKSKSKNLFQNLYLLNKVRSQYFEQNINEFSELLKMFQIRHCVEHNMGVIDKDCIEKIPELKSYEGKKYKLSKGELESFLRRMKELGNYVKIDFKNNI